MLNLWVMFCNLNLICYNFSSEHKVNCDWHSLVAQQVKGLILLLLLLRLLLWHRFKSKNWQKGHDSVWMSQVKLLFTQLRTLFLLQIKQLSLSCWSYWPRRVVKNRHLGITRTLVRILDHLLISCVIKAIYFQVETHSFICKMGKINILLIKFVGIKWDCPRKKLNTVPSS